MKYSQIRAMWAITKASFRSILRSPSSIVFSFVFPFVFILVFGFIGNSGGTQIFRIILDKNSDTSNALYATLKETRTIKFVQYDDSIVQNLIRRFYIALVKAKNKTLRYNSQILAVTLNHSR
ncbi:MAG: hypothetical protein EOP53_07030 [Sphingobacteriales bacterium]|nr:MAG: hypothetical protein EOP53_07030 [Sphingobacteriales bacterium]